MEHTRTADYWQSKYDNDADGWELGGPNGALLSALDLGVFAEHQRIYVPGAGRGWDAEAIARSGNTVEAFDFAPSAVAALNERVMNDGLALTAEQADVFAIERPDGYFDGAYDYTFYCAIDPALRQTYVDQVTRFVRPGGHWFMLAFPIGKPTPGPPHNVSLEELAELTHAGWDWVFTMQASTSPKPRQHMERAVLLRRK